MPMRTQTDPPAGAAIAAGGSSSFSMDGKNERKGYPVSASGYKLLEEIGQGVSATVYRALCLPFNEVVAVKSLDLEKCISNLDGIRREAQMMSLISHPNVVKAYCSFVVEQTLWVVMPYMAGGSCLHIMKSAYPDGFEEPIIATVLKEALKALEYLHRHGHIHRDVKAGNILVDANGAIKLGDFGVSACMFDTGDRQRSRNTFVGTPCWMAPEVMEQLHGYDFKADIWSFGITALELAHGHAPFSKYPPMKVLLMTLQNAPPGLDYERDKRFSKVFREMIAMCLVKDPAKRPSAEKLLKHSFFKHARNYEYIARHLLDGLPSLGERVMNLKLKDPIRLAQKKMPYGEQEELSQNEYKRGVSSWNFNVEDLKTQAAMIQGDENINAEVKVENEVVPKVGDRMECSANGTDVANHRPVNQQSPSLDLVVPDVVRPDPSGAAQPVKGPVIVDATTGAGDRITRVRVAPLPIPVQSKRANDLKGRFGGASELGSSNNHLEGLKISEKDLGDERQMGRKDAGACLRRDDRDTRDETNQSDLERKKSQIDLEERGRVVGATGGTERIMHRNRDEDKDRDRERDREPRQAVRSGENPQYWGRALSGQLAPSSVNKEVLDEKLKAGIVQKKGRFSITSENAMEAGPHSSAGPVPMTTICSQLQSVLRHCAAQQDLVVNLMTSICPGEKSATQRLSHPSPKSLHRSATLGSGGLMIDTSADKEREHLQQITELQGRVANLVDELQVVKVRNGELERQLNAINVEDRVQGKVSVEAAPHASSGTVPSAGIYSQLQSVLHHCAAQHDLAVTIMTSLCPGEFSAAQRKDKEREHLQQITEPQTNIAKVVNELQDPDANLITSDLDANLITSVFPKND